jgi:hypothetical protein
LVVINYIPLAIPQIAWLGVASIIKPSVYHWHGVFLGATAALLGLHISFECCVNNSSALGWFWYWPIALGAMVLAYLACTFYVARVANR